MSDALAFTCPRCGRTSYHPRDVAEGYCGACHDWTGTRPAMTDADAFALAGAAYMFALLLDGCPPVIAVWLAACRLVSLILAIARAA